MSGLVYTVPSYANRPTSSAVLGGPYKGYSPIQTINCFNNSDQVMARKVLSKSWNGQGALGKANGYNRVVTPFRAVNNLGDFLGRQNYVCGGSNQVNASKPGWKGHIGSIMSQCDGTGVPAGSGNGKFVPDSSDYTTYKKQRALNHNFNDLKQGGDQSNASYVYKMARF
jgi:hypothetical protein